jgi:hypothetical protein
MKRLFTLALLGLFSAGALLGCEASAKVGDEDADNDGSYRKTTTVRDNDGDVKRTETKTEIRRDND